MRSVGSMEPEGMRKGSTTQARTPSAITTASTSVPTWSQTARSLPGGAAARVPIAASREVSLVPQTQGGEKRLLRNLDRTDALHTALALLLLLEKFALARDVPAVALCSDVLAQRLDIRTCND